MLEQEQLEREQETRRGERGHVRGLRGSLALINGLETR